MTLASQPGRFDIALLESIEEAIAGLLGREVVDSLYLNLKTKRSLNREDIPTNLQTLSNVFEMYFGLSARTIERAIARNLCTKLGVEFTKRGGYTLADYAEEARNKSINGSR